MNKVFLIGRLTKDPEIRVTQTGKKVASFSIAVSDGKDQNGQELTQYFNCSAWERLAEIIEMYTPKGTKVCVIGKLQNRSWDKPDGTKGYATDILVRELEILSSKSEMQNSALKSEVSQPENQPKDLETKSVSHEIPEIDVADLDVTMPF